MKPKSANPTFEDQSSHSAPRALFSAFLATAFILQGVLVPVNAESRLSGLESSESRPLGLDEQAPIGSSRALHTRREQNDSAGHSYIERQLNGALQAAGEQLSGVFSNKQQFSSVLDGIKDGEVDLQEHLLLAGQERAQSMVDVGLKRLEERLEGRVLRNLELSYRAPFAGREDLFHANATLALWERSEQLLFGQGGLVIRDEKEGANIGLGYRFMAQQDLLLGVNAFYDYLSDPDVGRWSVGAEARSSWLDLYANWYQGTGDDREGDTLYYSPDGWDIELAAHLPDTPWIEAAASYYTWDGERGQDDLEGQRYRLSFKPSTLVGIGFEYDSPDEDSGSWGVEFDLNYQFGVPLSEQLNFSGNQGKLDLWSRRYEKVEREYAIRVREQRTAAAVPTERISVDSAQLIAGPVDVPVRLPAGRFYEASLTVADFLVTENLPGEITFTANRDSVTEATLTLTYIRAIPLPPTTPTGTIRITVLDTGLTGDSGNLPNQVIVDVLAAAPTTARTLFGQPLPFNMIGCSADTCVVPDSTGMAVSLPTLQVPVTPVEASTCDNCQVSLAFEFEFGGTAVYGTDYTVTRLALTPTRGDTSGSMITLPAAPIPPATASAPFMVTLNSLSTHYLNVTLTLTPDDDTEREEIQLVYVDEDGSRGAPQTVLTLETADTLLPSASVATTPLTEGSLVAGAATATVTLRDSEYVEAGALDTADFTLTANVPGTVTVAEVERTGAMTATLTLRHEGADISANGTLDVIVEASAHTGAVALYAGSVPITPAPGVTVTPMTLSVPEDGSSTDDYTLVLNTAPTAEVTIAVASSDTLAATVSSASLTFTPANWNTAQTVTVTGVNDDVPGDRTASLTHTAASTDGDYDGAAISIASVTVTVTDDDVASAVLAAADPTTLGERRLNSSTNRATVTVTLTNTVYEPSAELTGDDFMLTDTVDGDVTVESVTRDSDTVATLALAHTGAISSDGTVSVTVLAAAHTGSGDLDAGSLPIDATAPTVSSVAFSTTGPYVLGDNIEITITFSEAVFVEGTTPNAQLITANFMPRNVAYTSGDGSDTLIFRRTVVANDDDPDGVDIGSSPLLGGGGIIRDAAGNDVGRIGTNNQINGGDDQRIDTTTDTTLPLLSTATVVGATLTLTYNELLDDMSIPSTSTYTVRVVGNPVDVNSVAISGMTVTLTLATAVTGGDTVTLDYTPGANPVQDTAGNDAAALTNRGVTSTSGTVAVTLDDNIAGDDIVNIAEQAAGFTISGTVDTGATVEVTLDGGAARGTTETGTTWTLDIPANDGEIAGTSVVVEATATMGSATGTVSRTINVDLVAPTATYTPPATLTVGTATTTIMPTSPSEIITTYAVQSGTLPPGLTLASDTGFISGTPTTTNASTATVTIRLTDTAGNTTDDTTDVEITFPIVAIGSQTLSGFAYSADTATVGQTAPTVTAPSGAQTPLTYSSSTSAVCTVDAGTGALTLVATGDCDITVTASMTANYNEATADFTITVSAAVPSISIAAGTSPVTEGTAATFTLTADSAPAANLTITVTVTDSGNFIASAGAPTTVTIAASATTATLTVPTEDDATNEANGTITATVETGAGYTVAGANSASVTVNDDDAGVTVDPTELTVPEDGSSTGNYTVVLDTVPTADVIITVANSNTLAATVSPATTLTFTQTNWDTAQTVTVTGVNDNVDNPSDERTATLSHTANSADDNYSGVAITIASVTVTVEDDDAAAAGVTVTPTTLSVPEDGSTTADYTLVLDTAPTADVTIAVASDTDTAATVSSASLTFTPTNWNTAQTVTVTGVNDNVDNPGNARTASLTHVPTSTDTAYNSVSIDSVTVTVEDDDAAAAGVTVTPVTLSVPEDGSSTADYTLVLDTAPTADVTIAVASDTDTAATVSSASLTFTPTNWDTAQTVTVTGVNDDVDNPSDERTATVTHAPTSADAGYGSVVIDPVTVTVTDDDDAGVTVDPLALTVDEAGSDTTADYTLVLDTAPTADVTIAVASDTDTAATVSSASLTFTPTNWDTAQTVTVTGVNDDIDNPPSDERTATVSHTPASTDGNYEGVAISIASVTVTVEDDDDAFVGDVAVTLDADIAGDDIVNIAEKALGFTISGTVADGATVGVTLAGGSTRTATVSTTTWTLDIPADDDEITGTSVVVLATATLAGDTGTVTRTIDIDLAAPTATYAAPGTLTVGTAITDIIPGSPSADISNYALQASTLPPGLTLASDTGIISGIPTTVNATTADVTIRLTDEAGNPGDVPIAFPMVAMGSQVLDGFAYTPDTVALNAPTPPVVTLPSGVQTGSTLSYTSGDINICTVDSAGALTLVTAGACVITVTASATTNYNEATAEFTITVSPPAAGVTVDPTELTVDEADGTADYTLVLNTAPTADVTITVANSDTLAATVSSASLTFTTTDWDTAQTVTVTGVNDNTDNPSDVRTASLSHTAASTDSNYEGVAITIASVTVTVDDDDTASTVDTVAISSTGPYVLDDDIEVTVTFSEAVTVDTASGTPQIPLVVGANTRQAVYTSGSTTAALVFTYTVVAGETDADGVSIVENTLSGNGGTIRNSDGTDANLDHLAVAPDTAHAVDTTAPSVSAPFIVGDILSLFYDEDLDRSSTPVAGDYMVTVDGTPVDVTTVAFFSDTSLSLTLVTAVTPGQTVTLSYVSGASPLRDLAGNNAADLTDQDVDNLTLGAVLAALTLLTETNLNGATVTVTLQGAEYVASAQLGVDDFELTTDVPGTLTVSDVARTSPTVATLTLAYDNVDISTEGTLSVTVLDSANLSGSGADLISNTVTITPDGPPAAGVTVDPTSVTVPEASGTSTYTVVLDTQPTGDVTITPVSGDTMAATVSGALTFTTTDWDTAQTVTVTGVDDTTDNPGDVRTVTVTHAPTGADTTYNSVVIDSVTVTVEDDDDAVAGVTVNPTSVTVPEASGTSTYTVVLDTAPTADVTITPVSGDTMAAMVSGALTFTTTDWDTAQTVTVTGVDDTTDNPGDVRTVTVTHAPTGADTTYNSVSIDSVTVTVEDDDDAAAGVTVNPTELTVDEADGTGTYTLVLDTAPTADVIIAVASDTDTAATVSSASLTFTPANWDTAQTVTVTGVNDDVDNPSDERTASLSHTATSTDGDYEGAAIASVTVTVTDDDDAGVTVDPLAFTVDEAGSNTTADYTVVLDTAPTADVTIAVASDTVTAATVSSATLTFTPTNWNTAQTVTVTGVNDDVPGNRTATVTHTAASTDGNYEGVAISIASVTVTVNDDDAVAAGVTVTPTAFSVPEDGGTTADYTVVLDTAPTADVTIAVASDTVTAATVSSATLTFTPANWNTAQTVTVTGVNDNVDNPSDERTASLSHTATSADGDYEGAAIASVTVTVTDDDDAGVTVDPLAFTVDEAGSNTTADYTVVLDTAPTADVTIAVASDTVTAATVSSATLTFTPTDWDTAQTVTVTGVNDDVPGDRTATVTHTAASTDGNYEGVAVSIASVTVTVNDDDAAAAGVTVTPTAFSVPEDGGTTADYTVVLDTAPTADVTIAVASDTVTAATVSSATLTFTPANWNTAQTVTVTGVNDDVDNPSDERTASLSHTATSADGDYEGAAIASVTVTVTDDDDAGVTVDPLAFTVDEAGSNTTADYTVVLDTAPTADVTIAVASDTDTAATVSSASLTFTPTDWDTAQTVTVTGVNDDVPGDRTATVSHTAASADGNYEGVAISIASVTVTVTDDDAAAAGVTVTPPALSISEDGGTTVDYTLVLNTAPTADVTIAVASDTVTAATVSSASLTFTPANWNTAQTVTVTGVNDDVDNPSDERTASLSHTATSADGDYEGVAIASVTVTVTDDDDAGVTVDPLAFTVDEAGSNTTADYTVVLDTAPTADVTIAVASDTVTAATVSSATLTFTPTDWDTAQTVTVTGVNDDVPGNRTATVTHTAASTDGNYEGVAVSIASVTVTVNDDDAAAAGVTVTPTAFSVPEDGGTTADYTVVLDTAPTADVTIAVASDTVTAATVSSASLTFTPTNWDTAQTVTVTGVNDDVDNPSDERTASLSHTATSADGDYEGVAIASVTVTVTDDDDAGVTVDPMALTVDEAGSGTTADYTVVLDTAPTADVTIAVASDTDTAATVSLASLTFTPTDWDTAQTVTVTGVNDDVPGDRTATVSHTAASTDGNYEGGAISIASVTVTVTDDDAAAAGVTVTPTAFSVPEDGGTTADYTVVLDTAPTADVTIAVASDTVTAATVSSASLTFTPANWNTAQTVTVTGVNDDVDNPSDERTASLSHTATSTDGDYEGVAIASVTVTVTDDDDAGVTVAPTMLTVDEAGSDTTADYTVVLNTMPTADVTIAVASDTDTAATVSLASLTFTPTDWDTAQTVTVTGVNDDVPGDRTATVTHTAASADGNYEGVAISIASVTVTVNDDDTPVVLPSISIAAGTSPVNEGEDATFTLTADPAPATTLSVTIAVTDSGNFIVGAAPTTVTIVASATTAMLTVMTEDDSADEETGMITATVETGTGYTVGTGNTASVNVNDDDAAPMLAIDSPSVAEGDAGSTTLSYTVTLTGETEQEVMVDYADAGVAGTGTATSGTDYTAIAGGTLTFAPGTTTQNIDVTVTGDTADEGDGETVIVTLSNPVNATIATTTGTGTITDDDSAPVVAPTVSTVVISSTGPYGLGDNIEVTVTFSEEVTVSSTPRIILMLGASTRRVTFSSVSSNTLVFTYTVAAGDSDADGVSIAANTLAQAGGSTIRSVGGADADLDHPAVDPDTANAVDTTAPAVDTVEISTTGPYGLGDNIDVTVTFSEAVTVSGTPEMVLMVGSSTSRVTFSSGSGNAALVFTYTVQAGDSDDNGVSIAADVLAQDGGSTIRDAAGNDAALTHAVVDADSANAVDTTAPAVDTVEISTTGPYGLGDNIDVTVTFSEAVTVSGTPEMVLMVGSSTSRVTFSSGSGNAALVFTYTVQAGDSDADGVSIAADVLAQDGGSTIRDTAGNNATLTHAVVDADSANAVETTAPTVSMVEITSTGSYVLDSVIEVTVTFTEAVTVDTTGGTPHIILTVGSTPRDTIFDTGTGNTLVFTYTVQVGDSDGDGVEIVADALRLNGGTIQDAAGNNAVLTHGDVDVDSGDTVSTTSPAVSGVEFSSTGPYGVGEVIAVTVTFSEAVTVTDIPVIALTLGTNDHPTTAVDGSGSDTLVFTYTVVAGDSAPDGVSIAADALDLNGGTIQDAFGNDAALAHDEVAAAMDQMVTSAPPPPSSAPMFVRGVADGNNLSLVFDGFLNTSRANPAPGDFVVTRTAGNASIMVFGVVVSNTSTSIPGNGVVQLLTGTQQAGLEFTVVYTPGASPLQGGQPGATFNTGDPSLAIGDLDLSFTLKALSP